ncbi:hypothetical protein BTR14_19480 [Rhizobium rhizosphaerae]|uniref:Flagellar hook-length control protein-like C-terminal domain-containing protein n=1 Tax=Xaviernesmea rhizosphaerae TaxID=1672749 RepID=A0ABX3P9M4_9HYPH|nr:flagellar hook-length control protein FliK [Xaviernesmea rhizosphaerae]OQP84352.1 hypothetical protein BTR14_19480 [Xaviernesmea rhizosphaerae]
MTETALPLAGMPAFANRPVKGNKGKGEDVAGFDFAKAVAALSNGVDEQPAEGEPAAKGKLAGKATVRVADLAKGSDRAGPADVASADTLLQTADKAEAGSVKGKGAHHGAKPSRLQAAQEDLPLAAEARDLPAVISDEKAVEEKAGADEKTVSHAQLLRKAARDNAAKTQDDGSQENVSMQVLHEALSKLKQTGKSAKAAASGDEEAASDEGESTTAAGVSGQNQGQLHGTGAAALLTMLASAHGGAHAAVASAKGAPLPDEAGQPSSLKLEGMPMPRLKEAAIEGDGPDMPNGTVEAAPDTLFRFSRADGKGQAATLKVTDDGLKAPSAEAKTPAKLEQVTVLDSRRFLGVAMTTANAQIVTESVAKSARAGASTLEAVALLQGTQQASAAGKVLDTLKIQLHPNDIGPVTATLKLKEDELQVELRVQTGEAFRQLRSDQDAMVEALKSQGFSVDQINIVFTPASDTSQGGADGGGQGQQGAGQFGSGTPGQQAGEGRGQAGAEERGAQRQASRNYDGKMGATDASLRPGDPGQSGDIYL